LTFKTQVTQPRLSSRTGSVADVGPRGTKTRSLLFVQNYFLSNPN